MAGRASCVGTAFHASRVGRIEIWTELNAARRKTAKGRRIGAVAIAVNAPLALHRCLATVMNKGRTQRPRRLSRVRVEKVMTACHRHNICVE